MSTSEQPDSYALKKVGKFWLLGKPGKKDFKVCPLLKHAREVNISENFIIADENVYEIKEVEHEELLLVKVEEIKVCVQQNVKTQGNKPFFRYDRETNYDSGESLGQYNAEKTHFDTAYDVIKVTGESELEKMHDKYSSLEETGQTEDTSLIDNKVTDELDQKHDEYSSLEETCQTEYTSLIDSGFASKKQEDQYKRGFEQTSLVEEAQAQDWSPPRNFELAGKNYGYFEQNSQTYTKDAGYNKSDSVSNNGTSVRFHDKFKQDVARLHTPRGISEQNSPKDSDNAGSNKKTYGFSRTFSWSTRAKALLVYETKEKITVKVYSSDILCVPVDCIVNAAYIDLKHGGGKARAIADAAGKDLTKEGHDYLKQHGKLRVGEVCHTGAGKMSYNYVIHAVGPCWSDYKPYSLGDVEECETDLYNAVINSLSEAETLKMESIAVSSISSGIYGCPLDLCSIQYAKSVVDYSRCSRSPLKEIHFVDTNMEMVQVMHETFQSMIFKERVPKSYNKMRYVKSQGTSNMDKESSSRDNAQHAAAKAYSGGLVHYPYCHRDYPPEHSKKEFACCFGPGQNLYIYTADILQLTGIDMIACGNIPTGKTQGYLANAIKDRGGTTYNTELNKAFDKKCAAGNAVVCCGGKLKNFKWVTHAILYLEKQCKGDYASKVTSSLHNIFIAMKLKSCNSIALPLVGTGIGDADPAFYGQRFFEALDHFASFDKSYFFKVHLVHFRKDQTEKAIETIRGACKNAHPQLRRPNHGTHLFSS